MKFKSLVFVCLLMLLNFSFAKNAYHKDERTPEQAKRPGMPYFCEIEIINNSNRNLIVSGQFVDGCPIIPFVFYYDERPYYIDLWHDRYCQRGMYLTITDSFGYPMYSGYAPVHATIPIW